MSYEDGNLIEDEDFTYIYNDANQLSEVRYSGNNYLVDKYWYDANGERVKKQNSVGEFSYYVNQFYEVDNGTATSYFFRDDERIAKESSGDMEWYLSDHLGSTTLLINESGLQVERTEYYPFGEVQSGGLEKYGFTGQENDADTELMYYGARYYSPEYRVFVQPDYIIPYLYNPQNLNRYSYVMDNPVKYTDPTGNVADIGLDVLFLGADLVELSENPSDPWNWAAVGADVGCACLPFVTGGGPVVRLIKAGADDGVKVVVKSNRLLTRYGPNTGEALARISADVEMSYVADTSRMERACEIGTKKHYNFKITVTDWIRETGKTNVYAERSINEMGQFVSGNPKGSVRPDVIEIGENGVVKVYDLKTGGAKMTNRWMNKVQGYLLNNDAYNTVEFYEVKNGETKWIKTATRE